MTPLPTPDTLSATSKPSVLFVCVRNSGKSQMAAGIMRHAAAGAVNSYSAGTQPGTGLNPESVQALAEAGIDISGEAPKPIDPQLLQRMDVVVILGREAQLEPIGNVRIMRWDTIEPSDHGIGGMERMRLIRDDIKTRVEALLAELLPASS